MTARVTKAGGGAIVRQELGFAPGDPGLIQRRPKGRSPLLCSDRKVANPHLNGPEPAEIHGKGKKVRRLPGSESGGRVVGAPPRAPVIFHISQ